MANEWTGRTEVTGNTPPGSPATVPTPYTMTYDDAGNMTSDGKEYNYTYDVFGRLVAIDTVSIDDPVKSYRYNGLGWRITDSYGTDTEHLVYNERWQLVATYDGADVREQFVHHAAGLDGRGGSSYIDSVILRTTYDGTGGGVAEDRRFYYCQNWRADVSVILDDAGVQQERGIYSPYGQPFAMPAGDTNFDGDFEAGVDGDELADWDINGVPYRAYADVNLDGEIDGADATAASARDLGWNVLTSGGASGVNNRLGYAGYIHDRDVVTAAHVRYRVYKIDLGRWIRRDPLGYVDAMSLYVYVRGRPVARVDPSGLQDEQQQEGLLEAFRRLREQAFQGGRDCAKEIKDSGGYPGIENCEECCKKKFSTVLSRSECQQGCDPHYLRRLQEDEGFPELWQRPSRDEGPFEPIKRWFESWFPIGELEGACLVIPITIPGVFPDPNCRIEVCPEYEGGEFKLKIKYKCGAGEVGGD